MSRITLYEGTTPPAAPPSGVVYLYPKSDGRWYFMADDGIELAMRPTGAGTGDLLADGSVPLTANWDVGAFKITALQLESDVTTGTAPLVVASTTLVPNLNADLLDGNEAAAFATAAQGAKVDFLTVTQAVDLDAMEIRVNELDAAVVLKGTWDASMGSFPGGGTAQAGESWIVSVAGTVDSVSFSVDDRIIAITDNASTSVFAANWHKADYTDLVTSVDGNTGAVTAAQVTAAYDSEVAAASQAEMEAGTETAIRRMTPQRVAQAIAALVPVAAANNVQSGTTYTILASDNGKNIIFTNAASIAVTLPDTLDTDFQCSIIQAGTGIPTVTPNTDTINGAGSGVSPAERWKAMYLTQHVATEWIAIL